jgi:pimeloyl-ACP methyl ester carboxylesterase
MSEEQNWFWTSDHKREENWGPDLHLRLERYDKNEHDSGGRPRKPVLLLHGASACHRSFTLQTVGLAQALVATESFDPWLLDWRGSHLVVDDAANAEFLQDHASLFNFNRAAMEDLPAAIGEMRRRGVAGPISLLGHCMGSTVIAEAVAMGHVTSEDADCIVLSTLGLFYEAPIDSRLKSEERVLERLIQTTGHARPTSAINPRVVNDGTGRLQAEWPPELTRLYDMWPRALRSHDEGRIGTTALSDTDLRARNAGALCNRLSFMYGIPYHHRKLAEVIHGTDSLEPQLPEQFGAIPLAMYLNAAKNLRAGQALIVDEGLRKAGHDDADLVSDAARARFRKLKVTLVTGALNRLWHRDSIDRMHEWLCRGSSRDLHKIRKHVFPDYAHQDLWWADDSPKEIYPNVFAALR